MKKSIILICLLTLTAVVTFANTPMSEKELAELSKGRTLKEVHVDLDCADCHDETSAERYYLVKSESCMNCHGTKAEVAELTKHLDAKRENPHNGFHTDLNLECYSCHKEHETSINYCSICHDVSTWMKPTP